jgi:hypothetical protein
MKNNLEIYKDNKITYNNSEKINNNENVNQKVEKINFEDLIYNSFILKNLKNYNEKNYKIDLENLKSDNINNRKYEKNIMKSLYNLCNFTSKIQDNIKNKDVNSIYYIKKIGNKHGINYDFSYKLLKNLRITGIEFLNNHHPQLYDYILDYKKYIYKVLKICCFELANDIIIKIENIENENSENRKLKLNTSYLSYDKEISYYISNILHNYLLEEDKYINIFKDHLINNYNTSKVWEKLRISKNILNQIMISQENIDNFIKGNITFETFEPNNYIENYNINILFEKNKNNIISQKANDFIYKFSPEIYKLINDEGQKLLYNYLKNYLDINDEEQKVIIYISELKYDLKRALYNFVNIITGPACRYIFKLAFDDIFFNLTFIISEIIFEHLKIPRIYDLEYKFEDNEEYIFNENLIEFLMKEHIRQIIIDNFVNKDRYIEEFENENYDDEEEEIENEKYDEEDEEDEEEDNNKEEIENEKYDEEDEKEDNSKEEIENEKYDEEDEEEDNSKEEIENEKYDEEDEDKVYDQLDKLLQHNFKNNEDYKRFKNILGKYANNPEVIDIIKNLCSNFENFCDPIHIISMYHNTK